MEPFSPGRTPAMLRAVQTRSGASMRRSRWRDSRLTTAWEAGYPGFFEHRFWAARQRGRYCDRSKLGIRWNPDRIASVRGATLNGKRRARWRIRRRGGSPGTPPEPEGRRSPRPHQFNLAAFRGGGCDSRVVLVSGQNCGIFLRALDWQPLISTDGILHCAARSEASSPHG